MFACDKCPKRFTQPYNLEKHQRLQWVAQQQIIFFGVLRLSDMCLPSSDLPDQCDLPFCENHDDRCQQELNDESNFRAHIRQQHIEKFEIVPVWLNDAIEHCLGCLKTKSNGWSLPDPQTWIWEFHLWDFSCLWVFKSSLSSSIDWCTRCEQL